MSKTSCKNAASNQGRFRVGQHWRPPKAHWKKGWLYKEYAVNQRAAADIAAEMGCTENNILYWLGKHGIPARSMHEIRDAKHWGLKGARNPMFGKCGDKNPRWIDGSAPLRQTMCARSFWKELSKAVFERDGYLCRRCSAPHTGKNKLHAHHVKPWAGNPEFRFLLSNIITLCQTCHNWVHSLKNKKHEHLSS